MARYSIYVVELSRRVWTESARFRRANPQFNGALQCLYVGMTSKTPQVRFKQHKSGYKTKKGYKISAHFVEKYGLYLRPSLYENWTASNYRDALQLEEKLALQLRRARYAVWFN